MNIPRISFLVLMILTLVSVAAATQRLVPNPYLRIQDAINAANNGDTVSVWGPPPGQNSPPYTYAKVDSLKKSLVIASRCFLPGWQGCQPTWDSVVIQGTASAPAVTMTGSNLVVPRVVLKGFTITGGGGTYGGGIYCRDVVAVLEKNHVHHCAATFGGGICHLHRDNTSAETLYVKSCLIDSNDADDGGGGIYIDRTISTFNITEIRLQGNEIFGNTAVHRGGGVYMRQPYRYDESPLGQDDTILMDNVVHHNIVTGPLTAYGGGIITENVCAGWVIRNQITDNQPDGICMDGGPEGSSARPLILGTAEEPGFNVLMRNGPANGAGYDYRLVGNFTALPRQVAGNYWGTLDGASVRSHILDVNPLECWLRLDPIAASGKWFSVDSSSRCTTNVIVTGDLRVDSGAVLWIEPGKTLEFATWPDDSLPGGDPGSTDLILAPCCSLQAIGADALNGAISFTSRRNLGPPGADGWYGIRLKPGSYAKLRYCDVDSAYCGVEVDSAFAEIESSKVHDCEFAGVHSLVDGHVNVLGSFVYGNDVFGVRCEFPGLEETQEPCRVDSNQLHDNGYAGVSFDCAAPTEDAPHGTAHKVLHNRIVAGSVSGYEPPLYGIEISLAGDSVRVDSNYVSGFHQAGIVLRASRPSIVGDTVYGDTANGIACFDWSNPRVRWNTVDTNQNGVFCDASSFPDLGTADDMGYNSILLQNVVWVNHIAVTSESVMARLNWWGTDRPDTCPGKFFGNIAYAPWLDDAPGDGDGQQSGGPGSLVMETGLGRPLPMPVRGTARIPFQVAHAGPVSLNVVDASGRVVRALVRGERAPGRYNVTWDRSDNTGRLMPEGVYFLRFEAGARRDVQKLVVMR
jgi:hypothetical protein